MPSPQDVLAPLIAKERDLMQHIDNITECLKMLREEKNKLLIEQLQLESMIEQKRAAGRQKKQKQSLETQVPESSPPPDDENDINQQEVDLSVSEALCSILSESFFDGDDEEEESECTFGNTGLENKNKGEKSGFNFGNYAMLGFEGIMDTDSEESLI